MISETSFPVYLKLGYAPVWSLLMKIRSKENHRIANLGFGSGAQKEMALVIRGGEFIATEALSASTLAGLSDLARRRP